MARSFFTTSQIKLDSVLENKICIPSAQKCEFPKKGHFYVSFICRFIYVIDFIFQVTLDIRQLQVGLFRLTKNMLAQKRLFVSQSKVVFRCFWDFLCYIMLFKDISVIFQVGQNMLGYCRLCCLGQIRAKQVKKSLLVSQVRIVLHGFRLFLGKIRLFLVALVIFQIISGNFSQVVLVQVSQVSLRY